MPVLIVHIWLFQVSKRLKAVPLAFYQSVPSSLFPEKTEDFVGWSFKVTPEAKEKLIKSLPAKPDQIVVSNDSRLSEISAVSKEARVVPKKKRLSNGGSEIASEVVKAQPLSKKKKK